MREMAPGANVFFFNTSFFFFCAPRCHLTDGCHLTHTGAITQLNDFIQGFARHPRCHLSDGCENDVELLEYDSDVEFLGGGGKEGDIAG